MSFKSVMFSLVVFSMTLRAAAQALELPEFLKPGTRLTFEEGSAVVHGNNLETVPERQRNSGGVGFLTLDIVHASPQLVAADARSIMLVDAQNQLTQTVAVAAVKGDAQRLGQYWINPQALAALQDTQSDGQKISRIKHEANGKTYDAISIVNTGPANAYESLIYDLKTGVLLSASRSNAGDAGGAGRIGSWQGAAATSHSRFIEMRPLQLPWINEAAPPWATAGQQMVYQGGYQAILSGGAGLPPLPPLGMQIIFTFDQAAEGFVWGKMLTRSDIGTGLPAQENSTDRALGTAMLTPLWISPRVLGQLQPNQIIDQDNVTRLSMAYGGMQGNVGVFIEQGPLEANQYAYDLQSGMLVGIRSQKAQGPNQVQIDLQLTQGPAADR